MRKTVSRRKRKKDAPINRTSFEIVININIFTKKQITLFSVAVVIIVKMNNIIDFSFLN